MIPALLIALAFSASAHAGTADPSRFASIAQLCASAQAGTDQQLALLCNAARQTDAAAFIDDNNTRVWTPVMVNCGMTCLAAMRGKPSGTTCLSAPVAGSAQSNPNYQNLEGQLRNSMGGRSFGSSNPCASAVNSGFRALDSHKAYRGEDKAYYEDLDALAEFLKNGSAGVANADSGGKYSGAGGDMPEACQRARKTMATQDRFDCALATDPKMPRYIKDPRFVKEFQDATGVPLDSAINQSTREIYAKAAPTVLKRAYDIVKDKMSMIQLFNAGATIGKLVYNGLASNDDKNYFVKAFVPGQIRGFMPEPNLPSDGGIAGGRVANAATPASGGGAPTPGASATQVASATQQVGSETLLTGLVPEDDGSQADAKIDPKNNPKYSLFARVTRRYKIVTKANRLSDLGQL